MIRWSDLRREPFRVFFPLGVCFGLLGVSHWLCYAIGLTHAYSGFYHATIQVGSYMTCFVFGFLLTALPRFASAPPATNAELLTFLGFFMAQPLCASLGQWIAAELCFIGLLVTMAVFAGRRFAERASSVGPPTEFVWIAASLLFGVSGTALLILGQLGAGSWTLAMGRPMSQQGFLLSIVMGVGGFMAPRLMGRGFPTAPLTTEDAQRVRQRRMQLHVLAAGVLGSTFWMEQAGATRVAYLLRALVVTAELAWTTQWYRPPKVADLYVQFVWVSLWMVVLGLWLAVGLPAYRVAMLHIVFLGGFSLMTFAVGTMVVLSHSGQAPLLRRPLWVLQLTGAMVAAALVFRLVADALPYHFFAWLGIAAVCWSIAGTGWLLFILPRIGHQLSADEFERLHAEAKQRLLNTATRAG